MTEEYKGTKRKPRSNTVQGTIEYHADNNLYELVKLFQVAFEHGHNDGEPKAISTTKRIKRGKWMAEEIMEYIIPDHSDQIEQVDSLVDLLYFILGTYVMIGYDPFQEAALLDTRKYGRQLATDLFENDNGYAPADKLYMGSPREWRAIDSEVVIELIFDFIRQRSLSGQLGLLRQLMDWVLVQAAIVGVDLHPYFIIVHDANMGKLWPDGEPRRTDDGKIRKPNTYIAPQGEMTTLMLNDLDKERYDDEIPF